VFILLNTVLKCDSVTMKFHRKLLRKVLHDHILRIIFLNLDLNLQKPTKYYLVKDGRCVLQLANSDASAVTSQESYTPTSEGNRYW